MDTRIFRVRVSGQFGELSEATRQFLRRSAADHSPSSAVFGQEPNLTYPSTLDSLSVRLEVRLNGELDGDGDPSALASEEGVREAELFLNVLSIPHRGLRAVATELTSFEHRR